MQFENHLLSFDGAKVRPFSESCTKMVKKYAQISLLCAILISTFSKTGYITGTSRLFCRKVLVFTREVPPKSRENSGFSFR